jgi:hypothetical protein
MQGRYFAKIISVLSFERKEANNKSLQDNLWNREREEECMD